MRLLTGVFAAILFLCVPAFSQSPPEDKQGQAPQQEPEKKPAPKPQEIEKPEPEEPDFAFLSGSAYTQTGKSVQFIHQFAYGTRRFPEPTGHRNEDNLAFFFRNEIGLTDRWELDIVTPASGTRTRRNGATAASSYGYAETILGVRYQFFHERSAPFTLTMGPQAILPTGSVHKGTGRGSAGVAWDFAATRDWGGPVFLYTTLNCEFLPAGDDPTPGSRREFFLRNYQWATALGIRALEHPVRGSKHDIHVFLEFGGNFGDVVQPGALTGQRVGQLSWLVSPGVRYGFITPRKTLIEIGVAAPIGLGSNGPKKGLLVQFQLEKLFQQPR